MNYKQFKYDDSIMQSVTVGNIVDALKQCIESPEKLEDCAYFIITTRNTAMNRGVSRKANTKKTTVDKKIQKVMQSKEEE